MSSKNPTKKSTKTSKKVSKTINVQKKQSIKKILWTDKLYAFIKNTHIVLLAIPSLLALFGIIYLIIFFFTQSQFLSNIPEDTPAFIHVKNRSSSASLWSQMNILPQHTKIIQTMGEEGTAGDITFLFSEENALEFFIENTSTQEAKDIIQKALQATEWKQENNIYFLVSPKELFCLSGESLFYCHSQKDKAQAFLQPQNEQKSLL